MLSMRTKMSTRCSLSRRRTRRKGELLLHLYTETSAGRDEGASLVDVCVAGVSCRLIHRRLRLFVRVRVCVTSSWVLAVHTYIATHNAHTTQHTDRQTHTHTNTRTHTHTRTLTQHWKSYGTCTSKCTSNAWMIAPCVCVCVCVFV